RRARLYLYGSFARTYRGHGTDLALLAGLLGLSTDDPRIPEAQQLAAARGMQVELVPVLKGGAGLHPNTAELLLASEDGRQVKVRGQSVGGGNVVITAVDDFELALTGQYPALLTRHRDEPGVVARVTGILAQEGINIAFLRLSRQERGSEALMVIETDQGISEEVRLRVAEVPGVVAVRTIPALKEVGG
ncbi:MAG: ACT domain-containing protein, partial [Bacillota bacterium]|nr:ACT domain-containing protein [Bacillota bacterium]